MYDQTTTVQQLKAEIIDSYFIFTFHPKLLIHFKLKRDSSLLSVKRSSRGVMMKERSVKHDRHGLVSLSCYTWSEYVYFSFVHVDNLISRCDLPTPLLHSNNTTAVICRINITITNCIQFLYFNQIRFDKFSSHDSTVNKLVIHVNRFYCVNI